MKFNYLDNEIKVLESTDAAKPKFVAVVNDLFAFYGHSEMEAKSKAFTHIDKMFLFRDKNRQSTSS